jgi:hypothetical protein
MPGLSPTGANGGQCHHGPTDGRQDFAEAEFLACGKRHLLDQLSVADQRTDENVLRVNKKPYAIGGSSAFGVDPPAQSGAWCGAQSVPSNPLDAG